MCIILKLYIRYKTVKKCVFLGVFFLSSFSLKAYAHYKINEYTKKKQSLYHNTDHTKRKKKEEKNKRITNNVF